MGPIPGVSSVPEGQGQRCQLVWEPALDRTGPWQRELGAWLLGGRFAFPASPPLSPFAAAWIPRLLLLASLLALPGPGLALEIHNGNIFKGPTHRLRNHPRALMAALPVPAPAYEGEGNSRQRRDSDLQLPEGYAFPRDCSEITWNRVSGVFIIQPAGLHQIVVSCDLNSTSEGWTVLQRNRHNTQLTWSESWSTYKYGFGDVHSDYWLGMEYIYQITKQKVYQVRFIIHDSSGTMKYADYNLFSLEDESKGYRLRLGSYSGTAGDAMTSNSASSVHDNMKFTTKDLDQDTYSGNCASSYGGGWWYSGCYSARLNVKGSITWGSLCSGNCQASAILIKPASYC
ncbi:fibrinogen-like protein 1-like protein isoform X2 [Pelodiscus sinensis]|uniref:fibrinogen-like protein 1-like protein isoform X2 n=1 Tax=Pelodiscus sinensis TaxID=13735 RepID=UPI003F6D4EA6